MTISDYYTKPVHQDHAIFFECNFLGMVGGVLGRAVDAYRENSCWRWVGGWGAGAAWILNFLKKLLAIEKMYTVTLVKWGGTTSTVKVIDSEYLHMGQTIVIVL